jgi:SAM-dependent methyltransferase
MAYRRNDRLDRLGASLDYRREISPEDNMIGTGPERYFRWGLSALECIRLGLRAAEYEGPLRTVLDLPCGHGRVLRMLAAAYPGARLHACDLNEDAVRFCSRTFGAVPVLSDERPEQIVLPGRYDLIWVGSLFTHIDVSSWLGFLRLLIDHMTPGGVLVFTTLGRTFAGELERAERKATIADPESFLAAYQRDGFAYQDFPSTHGYGLAAARPSWVCATLEQYSEIELISYTEGGWNGRQDAVACRRRVPRRAAASPEPPPG